MSSFEEDPYTPSPDWIDWVLSEITVIDAVSIARGAFTGHIAVITSEVIASQSAKANVGDIARNVFQLDGPARALVLDDELRTYACLGMEPLPQTGDTYLVSTYFLDSDDGMSRHAVTVQWEM